MEFRLPGIMMEMSAASKQRNTREENGAEERD
jgi:hypothetical protein